jgi:putative selenium metabolism hydrolase
MDTQKLVEFAQSLVQRPSLSCQEGAVSRRAEEEMRALGFDEVTVDENGSVVGVVHGSRPGKTLLLDGHTDTVDVTGGVPWARDPFSGVVENGAIHGRGSADMKGALAAMIHAVAGVDRSRLRGRVVVSASTMEEILEGVALSAVMEAYPPDFVVIGEATELNLARGGRGRAEVHLKTVGIPTHSSAPHLGRNAVLDMATVMSAIEEVPLQEDPLMGPAILALTEISSAPFPANSVIPSICRTTYDRRLLPGETEEQVLGEITSLPRVKGLRLEARIGIGEYTAFTGNTLRKNKFFPAWLLPEEDWLVVRALEGLASKGLSPSTGAYQFCTNAAYSAGEAGVPTVGFGPGKETDAHVVNENLRIKELEAAARGYLGIVEAVLGES